jgi:hypothetical protein
VFSHIHKAIPIGLININNKLNTNTLVFRKDNGVCNFSVVKDSNINNSDGSEGHDI